MNFETDFDVLNSVLPSASDSLRILAAFASMVLFAQFSFATKTHFATNGEVPAGMKLLGGTSVLGFILFLFFLYRSGPTGHLAFFPYVFSQLIFIWAKKYTKIPSLTLAYSTDSPRALVDVGPFRWIRHPFYTSYILYWAANALAVPTLALWVVCSVLCLLYFRAARLEERKFYDSALRKNYAEYRARTTMFVPFVF